MRTLDMFLNNMDILTPAEYLELATKHPERIKDAHMILPRIGKDNHFGKFQVVFYGGSGMAIGSYYQKSKNLNSQNDNRE